MSGQKTGGKFRSNDIFFGSLPSEVTEDALKEFYSDYGKVESVKFIKKTRKPSCGFLRFADADSVGRAMAGRPHTVKGKPLTPTRAALGDDPARNIQVVRLFVGSLKLENREEDKIREVFGKYGDIEEIKFKNDDEGKRRNFAVITYADPDSCDKAILIEGKHKLGGQDVNVKKFLNDEQQKEVREKGREREMRDGRSGRDFGGPMGFPGRPAPFGGYPPFQPSMGKILGGGIGAYGMPPSNRSFGAGPQASFGRGFGAEDDGFPMGGGGFGQGGVTPYGGGPQSGYGASPAAMGGGGGGYGASPAAMGGGSGGYGASPAAMGGGSGGYGASPAAMGGGGGGYGASPAAMGGGSGGAGAGMNNVGYGKPQIGQGSHSDYQPNPNLRAILLKAKVSEEAVELLARENLLDTELLRSTTVEEMAALGLPFGDRKRIQILMS